MIKLKVVSVISLILSIILISTGCGKKSVIVTAQDNIKNVKVASVSNSSIETDTTYGSKLTAASVTTVTSKIAGKIDSVKVDVGQQVKKGDILFTLDSKELQAQYAEAKGALATANSSYQQQLITSTSSANVSQNSYKDAQNNYNAVHQQYNIGESSKDQLDASKSKLDSATLQLKAATDSLELLKSKISGQVEQAQGALDLAQLQINNSAITSPIDGIVSVRNIEVGEMISSSITAFNIIDTSSLLDEVTMTDKAVIRVKIGQKIPVQITSMDNKVVEGIVDTISATADAKTQLYTVKLRITNKDNSLKTGMIARSIFPNEIKNHILVVPNVAIFTENSIQYVYIVDVNKLKKVEITLGISNVTQSEIISGIKLGDSVIIEGQSFLADGQKVNVTK